MTDEEKNAAAAYIKLQFDVKKLILEAIAKEVTENPSGEFSTKLIWFVRSYVVEPEMKSQMGNYRIVYKGTTASLY
jgi:hypothetical protein